jgi:hypothetical protein
VTFGTSSISVDMLPSQPSYIKAPPNEPQVMWGMRPVRSVPEPVGQTQHPRSAPESTHVQQSVQSAQSKVQDAPLRQDVEGGDESVSEALSKDVFSTYTCRSLNCGIPHPGDIAEASGLRCDLNMMLLGTTSEVCQDQVRASSICQII